VAPGGQPGGGGYGYAPDGGGSGSGNGGVADGVAMGSPDLAACEAVSARCASSSEIVSAAIVEIGYAGRARPGVSKLELSGLNF